MEVEGAEQEQAQGTGLQGSQWGNLPFSMEYVLSLSAVQNICGVASHLADLMPVESSVCVMYQQCFHVGCPVCSSLSVRKSPTSRRPLVLSGSVGSDTELEIFLYNFSQGPLPRGKGILSFFSKGGFSIQGLMS